MSDDRAEALPTQLEGIKYLNELALEVRVSWDHSTDDIWRRLDPELWDLTRNPTLVLHATSEATLKELAGETEFRRRVEDFVLAPPLFALARLVSVRASRRARDSRRIFQHGIRIVRGLAHLPRRPWQCGRRPA